MLNQHYQNSFITHPAEKHHTVITRIEDSELYLLPFQKHVVGGLDIHHAVVRVRVARLAVRSVQFYVLVERVTSSHKSQNKICTLYHASDHLGGFDNVCIRGKVVRAVTLADVNNFCEDLRFRLVVTNVDPRVEKRDLCRVLSRLVWSVRLGQISEVR